ncbi:DUF167 domain-containing protein [Uliginosibacterium sp. H3]|uniref:UPF0235 protein VVD49_08000 n=1 Tax=Uliginosibacterium silvisoli TaxID=3114758 RepID=A0ABU6K3N5_9RHOO|nr:DUF167 domain-containing protein [Uliginosibacterium sp. H3]
MNWLRRASDGTVTLTLHAQPGAKRTEFAGLYGEALKIRLAAPPIDGKANAVLTNFLATYLSVPKVAISILSGESSRHKILWVQGAGEAALAKLEAEAEPPGKA